MVVSIQSSATRTYIGINVCWPNLFGGASDDGHCMNIRHSYLMRFSSNVKLHLRSCKNTTFRNKTHTFHRFYIKLLVKTWISPYIFLLHCYIKPQLHLLNSSECSAYWSMCLGTNFFGSPSGGEQLMGAPRLYLYPVTPQCSPTLPDASTLTRSVALANAGEWYPVSSSNTANERILRVGPSDLHGTCI